MRCAERPQPAAVLDLLAGRRVLRHEAANGASERQPRVLSSRSCSRFQSRSLIVSRLSCTFLPRASASSTFARPLRVEIDRQRHERQPLAGDRAVQLGDLAPFEQQLARPARLVVEAVAVAVFGDVAVDQPDLLALDRRIAFGDRALAVAKRLHLGPGERDPGLEPVLDEIVEARAPVLGDDLLLVERLAGAAWTRADYRGSNQAGVRQCRIDRALRRIRRLGQRQPQLGRKAGPDPRQRIFGRSRRGIGEQAACSG